MGKEWIASLAQNIKQKNHEAAENYGREQHKAGIITAQGKSFFVTFVLCLQEDINNITSELQGDVTASEITVQIINPIAVTLSRSRFPWFDAHITHQDTSIVLEYAKGLGLAGDSRLTRKFSHFAFHVADDDTLSVQASFSDNPRQFRQPDDLARHIIQILFQV